jgi:hypothetical protein
LRYILWHFLVEIGPFANQLDRRLSSLDTAVHWQQLPIGKQQRVTNTDRKSTWSFYRRYILVGSQRLCACTPHKDQAGCCRMHATSTSRCRPDRALPRRSYKHIVIVVDRPCNNKRVSSPDANQGSFEITRERERKKNMSQINALNRKKEEALQRTLDGNGPG